MKQAYFILISIMLFAAIPLQAQLSNQIYKSINDSCFQPGDIILSPKLFFRFPVV